MLPFNLTFRQLLLRYIPQVKKEDIDRFERLTALRHQLYQELIYVPPGEGENGDDYDPGRGGKPDEPNGDPEKEKSKKGEKNPNSDNENDESTGSTPGQNQSPPTRSDIRKQINIISSQSAKIFKGVEKDFEKVQKLWVERRALALEQGNYLQIPPTVQGVSRFTGKKLKYYFYTGLIILPKLQFNRVKYFVGKLSREPLRLFYIAGVAMLAVYGGNIALTTRPPMLGDIIDQKIQQGKSLQIQLDNFVEDADTPDRLINWSTSGGKLLEVNIDQHRVAHIGVRDSTWSGSETITFTATDPDGNAISKDVTFTVTPKEDSINGQD